MSNKFRSQTMVELGYVILFEHRDAFPQLSLLLAAGLLIPVKMLDTKGDFMSGSHIVTKLRNNFLEKKIDYLIRIYLECPSMQQSILSVHFISGTSRKLEDYLDSILVTVL